MIYTLKTIANKVKLPFRSFINFVDSVWAHDELQIKSSRPNFLMLYREIGNFTSWKKFNRKFHMFLTIRQDLVDGVLSGGDVIKYN